MPIMLPDWNEYDTPDALRDAVRDVLRRNDLPQRYAVEPADFDGPLAYLEHVRDRVNALHPDSDMRIPKDPAAQEETKTIAKPERPPGLPSLDMRTPESKKTAAFLLRTVDEDLAERIAVKSPTDAQRIGQLFHEISHGLLGVTAHDPVGTLIAYARDWNARWQACRDVLQDYPAGQDDGTWLKRRDAALAGLTAGQSTAHIGGTEGEDAGARVRKVLEAWKADGGRSWNDVNLLIREVEAALPAPTPTQDECPDCSQVDVGQTGEHPCVACGLPQEWDDNPTTNLLNRLLSAGIDGVPYLNPAFKDRAEPAKAVLALMLDQMTSPTDRHNGLTVGQSVHVFDRYRFSIPLSATVTELSPANDGVKVQLHESNNHDYPVGSLVWVHALQCRAIAGSAPTPN